MKRQKFGLGLKIASIFTGVAIVSVGFAAWVISAPQINTEVSGTISVDDVNAEGVSVITKWVTSELGSGENDVNVLQSAPVIYYGSSNTEGTTYSWLSNNSEQDANLVAYLEITISKAADFQFNNSINVTLTAKDVDGATGGSVATFNSAISGSRINGTDDVKLIAAPTISSGETTATYDTSTSSAVYSWTPTWTDNTTATIVLEIEFAWGEAFGSVNAYDHYNSIAYSEDIATQAQAYLEALKTSLDGIGYNVDITEVAGTPEEA